MQNEDADVWDEKRRSDLVPIICSVVRCPFLDSNFAEPRAKESSMSMYVHIMYVPLYYLYSLLSYIHIM